MTQLVSLFQLFQELSSPSDNVLWDDKLLIPHAAHPHLAWLILLICIPAESLPDSKVHGANMGSITGRQDPGGPHVGPMNFTILAASN